MKLFFDTTNRNYLSLQITDSAIFLSLAALNPAVPHTSTINTVKLNLSQLQDLHREIGKMLDEQNAADITKTTNVNGQQKEQT